MQSSTAAIAKKTCSGRRRPRLSPSQNNRHGRSLWRRQTVAAPTLIDIWIFHIFIAQNIRTPHSVLTRARAQDLRDVNTSSFISISFYCFNDVYPHLLTALSIVQHITAFAFSHSPHGGQQHSTNNSGQHSWQQSTSWLSRQQHSKQQAPHNRFMHGRLVVPP